MGQLSQLETHPLAQPSRPTSDALDSPVKRTSFMSDFMYFLDLSMRKHLCLGIREGLLIILLTILPRMRLRVVFCYIWQPSFVKDSVLLVAPRILYICIFSIDSYLALTLILNPRDQNEVSFLKDFSKILPLSQHGELFFHQLIYLSCLLLFLLLFL